MIGDKPGRIEDIDRAGNSNRQLDAGAAVLSPGEIHHTEEGMRPGGLEPPTNSLEGCCSIHLSYGRDTKHDQVNTAWEHQPGPRVGSPCTGAYRRNVTPDHPTETAMTIARRVLPAVAPALLLMVGITGSPAAQDPPERVGRVSFISGPVSLRPGGMEDWDNAPLNYPLTTGDLAPVAQVDRAAAF